jgi:hypothetical protein
MGFDEHFFNLFMKIEEELIKTMQNKREGKPSEEGA